MARKRTRTREEIADDQRAFASVNEVLSGRLRVPLDGGSSKLLRFMLHREEGCDATLSAEEFQVRFGWNPGPHAYFLNLAPACVSQLLAWSGVTSVQIEMHVRVPGTEVDREDQLDFLPWSFATRQLWLRREEDRVVLAIRSGKEFPTALTWPAPIVPWDRTQTTQTWRDLAPPQPCPHCGRLVSRARELRAALVCPHCARSYETP